MVEVGAGLGALTVALAAAAAQVIAIEIDKRLVPAVEEVTRELPNVTIVTGDALDLDYRTLLKGGRHRFVSNLPYNIATPLTAKLVEEVGEIGDFVVLVQKEIGQRLVARPGSKAYGAVSVLIAYHCDGRMLGRVPPTVFWPQPEVESVIVHLVRRAPVVSVPLTELMSIVRAAFGQRRKTVRNALVSGLRAPAQEVEAALERAGLRPSARAEQLSLEEFASLAEAFR